MKKAMIEITLWDKIRNEKFRSTTKMTNVLRLVTQLKWRWAGPRQDDQGAERLNGALIGTSDDDETISKMLDPDCWGWKDLQEVNVEEWM